MASKVLSFRATLDEQRIVNELGRELGGKEGSNALRAIVAELAIQRGLVPFVPRRNGRPPRPKSLKRAA